MAAPYLSPPQKFKCSLYKSAVEVCACVKSNRSIRWRTSAKCLSISRTSLSFSSTDFSALAKFDSLKLTETHSLLCR